MAAAALLAASLPVVTQAASQFSAVAQPLGSIAPLVLSNTNLAAGGVTAYRPWFENGAWQGDIVQYNVSAIGALSSSVEFSGASPSNPTTPAANWSALEQMGLAEVANTDFWDTGREIITALNDTQRPFRWGSANISDAMMEALDKSAADNNAASSDMLDYVRGDRSNEYPNGEDYRARVSLIGDIIHSNPIYVGAPRSGLTDNSYATWAASNASRAHRVYVGANDGMLHAFDASTGDEVFAYVPSMVIPQLKFLAQRPYDHTYYVDGRLTAADAYFGSSWHTVLVGTLGAGGKGVFALDVTNPNMTDETSSAGADTKVLWEIGDSNDDDLGDSFSRPVIAKLNDGNWYAVVGNGYNSANGVAMLYLIDLETGVVTKVTTGSGSSISPNGLSSPALLDTNQDGAADFAYAGDIDGNLWKFDLSSTTRGNWAEAYGRPLHPGASTMPITTAPEIVAFAGNHMIYFGTGRLFTSADLSSTDTQAIIGVLDDGSTPPDAQTQSLLTQGWGDVKFSSGGIEEDVAVRNPDAGSVDWANQHGWKLELPAGLRVLEDVQVRGARVKASVTHPDSKKNWVVEASYLDGGPHSTPIFDLSRDNLLGTNDLVDGNNNNALTDGEDIPMGWQRYDGIMSRVTIARVANGVDVMMLNYLNPPVGEPCTGTCEGGFQAGHIDVDTWHDSKQHDGKSSKHTHEYDDDTGRVFVDMFDINVEGIDGHIELDDDSGIASDEEFIVLVANADFSPGSTFQIGNKTWNVVEYQREIHVALKNWNASDPNSQLVDSDGDSLIFTLADVQADGGTIRHNFNSLAIINGGLHPTQTGCVKDDAYETFNGSTLVGRARNGALITQVIKADYFTASSAITQLDIQLPEDLVTEVVLEDRSTVYLTQNFDGNPAIDSSNHEIIGGLLARADAEHLWASTLFWHFGEEYKDVLGGDKPCYGEDEWQAAVDFERSDNKYEMALQILGIDDPETCKNVKVKKGGCKEIYKDLLALESSSGSGSGSGSLDGSGLDGDGETAEIVEGGAEDQGFTVGPDFDFGRLNWTDIVLNGGL